MHRVLAVLIACLLLASPAWALTVDINKATEAELDTLPGIGPAKAADIVAYRQANGPFTSADQLDNVPGIGPATLGRLLPLITVDGATVAQPAPAEAEVRATEQAVRAAPRGDLGLVIESAPEQPAPVAAAAVAAQPSGGGIDINSASAAELMDLPGIGASKAALIVASREQQGPFASCLDLQRVNGIGAKTVANLEHMCSAGAGGRPAASSSGHSAAAAPAAPAYSGAKVDINSASESELDSLPGIGASKAALIIASREQQGPFASCQDLQRVNGIGAKTVANLEHMCEAR